MRPIWGVPSTGDNSFGNAPKMPDKAGCPHFGARAGGNDEHVALLRQGTEVWNEWRKRNPDVMPDVSRADLSGADLSGADLTNTKLVEADLNDADLSGADLSRAFLSRAVLLGAKLTNANVTSAELPFADLFAADLTNADLSGADLSDANLTSSGPEPECGKGDLRPPAPNPILEIC